MARYKIGKLDPNLLRFNVSPRFSQLIGRQLISNPTVAVLELIKNSYDADADNITVTFEDISSNQGKIIIKDDGDGMTLNDLKTKWMVVGTDDKLHSVQTKKGRRKLGEKGIGRFSVERLARKTTIRTFSQESSQLIELVIDWDKYETENKFFNQITHPIKYETVSDGAKGTEIILEGLRENWSEEMIASLRKEVFLLLPLDIGKLSVKFKSEVKVNVKCNDYPNKSGELQEKLLQHYHARLYGEIFEDGSGLFELNLRLKKKNSAQETGIKYERKLTKDELDYTCGPVVFEAFAFLRDGRLYRGLDFNKDVITKLLDDYSGIRIYRDDFRVKPYGDPNNDWLNLNLERVKSPEYRLATNQVIGGVKISRDSNPGLQDVLSRENLYETQEFKDLTAFINRVFNFYTYASFVENRSKKKEDGDTREELYTKIIEGSSELKDEVSKGLRRIEEKKENLEKVAKTVDAERNVQDIPKEREKAAELDNFVDDVKTELNKISELADRLKSDAVEVTERIKEKDSFKKREMQIYRNIASLGISAAQFGHETAKLILNAVFAIKALNRFEEIKAIKSKGVRDELTYLEQYLTSANQKADFFRGYLMREKQGEKKKLDVIKVFAEVIQGFEKSFKDKTISIEIIDNSLGNSIIEGYYGDMESIITNLLTNAYKALTQGSDDKKFFKVTFNVKDNDLIINAINTGKPIEPEHRSQIFEPMFTTHKHGTGLGLPIIDDTLKSYGGNIKLLDEYPITNFEIQIPLK